MFCRLLLSLLLSLGPVSAIWPAPQSYTSATSVLFLNQNLKITYNGGLVRWFPSSSPPDSVWPIEHAHTENDLNLQLPYVYGYVPSGFESKQIVQAGVSRALTAIFQTDFVPWKLHPRNSDFEPDVFKPKTWVKSLAITQTGKDTPSTFKPLAGGVDESYNLTLSEDGDIALSAVSSTGVLRGLETVVQLFYKHSSGTFWYTPYAPVSIQDSPTYSHRGILMDVARNWFSVADITKTIDALSWNKMNRLHLHVTDSQSWPLEIPSIPELAKKGAYRSDLTYSAADIQYIQEYGVYRGVEVYLEIDMPGHIGSVAWSHPELITAYDAFPYYWWCAEPPCGAFRLNDTAVDAFLEKVFDDLFPRLAPYSAYFHTGGDELNANDSMLDPGLKTNASDVLQPLLQKFINAQHARVRKAGLSPMVWEEIPLDWNVTLGNDTVVQTWLGASSVKSITELGHKVIDSDYNFWVRPQPVSH